MSQELTIAGAAKLYGDFRAVDGVSLHINRGEFFTLLGPSGCGKTTLLRMIAGFNTIDEGTISFGDTVINHIPPYKRNTGMVFQNYAVFPHMSVFDNVAYGLRARKVPKAELEKRVTDVLRLIRIEEYRDRRPSQLSGGQQQRIALARAIVINPDILLMDEPLSNLDAKLRVEMRVVIKDIQKRLNITTIYVTHDQEEALAVSDRIAVMNMGHVQQVGEPYSIYSRPANVFVAGFIGVSNFLECQAAPAGEGGSKLTLPGGGEITVPLKKPVEGKVIAAARPEEAFLVSPNEGALKGEISQGTFLGDNMNYRVTLENGQIIEVNEYTKDMAAIRESGAKVGVAINTAKINVFSADGLESLI
jgi:iron(III) transport system ATP-binding protein